ncbi:uncharacterized protein N7511_011078 [Penicillium nucicola]|uniref:uncharacterized protein n=1 Tax=Penicillium nucicola TaxID=1850975 RepID=UPI0025456B0B|nr:uncharacterized protein N7511_011078 [Penicillium nucicola]KAJ5749382.1 hypothetical protein N7511_011078 [Penicillium nucicola]
MEVPHFQPVSTNCSYFHDALASHMEFMSIIQPQNLEVLTKFRDRCIADIVAVNNLFPYIHSEAVQTCLAGWMATVCITDDILERMSPESALKTLEESIWTLRESGFPSMISPTQLKNLGYIDFHDTESRQIGVPFIFTAFYNHAKTHLNSTQILRKLVDDICEMCEGQRDEVFFRQGRLHHDMDVYMGIRKRTMGVLPSFTIMSVLTINTETECVATLKDLGDMVCQAVGLQNDIAGLDKDIRDGEIMNSVLVLAREQISQIADQESIVLHDVTRKVCDDHNRYVLAAVEAWERLEACTGKNYTQSLLGIIILEFAETHLKWCLSSKRYHVR